MLCINNILRPNDKLLLSNYKRYNLIGYQSLDYLFFVIPDFEKYHPQFKQILFNIISNVSNHINNLISKNKLTKIKNINLNSDVYLVYRINFNKEK